MIPVGSMLSRLKNLMNNMEVEVFILYHQASVNLHTDGPAFFAICVIRDVCAWQSGVYHTASLPSSGIA